MTVRLRGHHLLCMLAYVGKGYTPQFVANYDFIVSRLRDGELIEIVAGPDAICEPMLGEVSCHCFDEGIHLRDDMALADLSALLNVHLEPGVCFRLDGERLANMRDAFRQKTIRRACSACGWSRLCDSVAEDAFRLSRLTLPVVDCPASSCVATAC